MKKSAELKSRTEKRKNTDGGEESHKTTYFGNSRRAITLVVMLFLAVRFWLRIQWPVQGHRKPHSWPVLSRDIRYTLSVDSETSGLPPSVFEGGELPTAVADIW